MHKTGWNYLRQKNRFCNLKIPGNKFQTRGLAKAKGSTAEATTQGNESQKNLVLWKTEIKTVSKRRVIQSIKCYFNLTK
jgi:hypothetical protein